jgi:hypothetical protein
VLPDIVFCIRKADNIAVLGFVKADKARKPCHLRNLDQGVVIILAVVYARQVKRLSRHLKKIFVLGGVPFIKAGSSAASQ